MTILQAGPSWADPVPWWAEWLGIVSTAGAALFAAWAINQARRQANVSRTLAIKQAKASAASIIRERQIDFELGVLKEMAEWLGVDAGDVARPEQIRTRLMLSREVLGLTRAAYRPSDPLADGSGFDRRLSELRTTATEAGEYLTSGIAAQRICTPEVERTIRQVLARREVSPEYHKPHND